MTLTKGKIVPVSAAKAQERALVVGAEVRRPGPRSWTLEDSVAELAALAASAGAHVVGSVVQRLQRSTHMYVGKGKLSEIKETAADLDAGTVILDDELSLAQQRNLEEALPGLKVLDRTALILDIFAQRANTREGRLQVELAQNEYLMPRLVGQWSHLERLGGGIGTRGPGESQLETDRRLVRQRIHRLHRELDDVRRRRAHYRGERRQRGLPAVSLVGYTNAGKSTLMNALTRADVVAADKLFATLDPVTRTLRLPSGGEAVLTDTVGFIQKLPHGLVAAFRATLEELQEADVLVIVADASHPAAVRQHATVRDLVEELGVANKPRVLVLNKIDLLPPEGSAGARKLLEDAQSDGQSGGRDASAVAVSALTGQGLDALRSAVDSLLIGEARIVG